MKIEAAAVHGNCAAKYEDGVEKARAREALRGQSLQADASESMATREADADSNAKSCERVAKHSFAQIAATASSLRPGFQRAAPSLDEPSIGKKRDALANFSAKGAHAYHDNGHSEGLLNLSQQEKDLFAIELSRFSGGSVGNKMPDD